MTTLSVFPSEFPAKTEEAIYTNVIIQTNPKYRDVYCPACKFKVNTSMVGAQCKSCNSDMVTMLVNSYRS